MAIANYSDLVTSIGTWTHRSDLAAVIPDFIRLAESRLQNDLNVRQLDITSTLTTTGGTNTVALPADFNQARSVVVQSSGVYQILDYVQPDILRQRWGNYTASTPKTYSITGTNMLLGPAPDAAYPITLEYNPLITGLSVSNPTNSVLTAFPEIYLHACLGYAAQYLRDAEMMAAAEQAYQDDMNRINVQNWGQMSSPAMRTVY